MASVNSSIFRAYDIRGVYGQDFDANFAEEFGNKLAQKLGPTLVVGRDHRASSEALEKAVIQGMLHAGARIYAIDDCTTPAFYYAVHTKKASGGVMVTASHNPGEYNGLKVVDGDLRIMGGPELMDIYTTTDLDHSGGGMAESYGAIGEYADAVAALAGPTGGTLAFGMKGSTVNQKILTRISEKVGLLLLESNRDGLEIVFDEDADRITFFDRRRQIDADLIALLIAEKMGFKKIVHDFRFARPIKKRLKELGVAAIPSRVGRIFMQESMRSYDADFGAELSGHYYFRNFQYLEAPEAVLLYIRTILQKEGKNLAELVKPYDTYFRTPELAFPINPASIERLAQKYHDGRANRDDGLSVEYDDWWFNIRPSNTEPLMRLLVEAHDEETLQRKVEELNEALRR